VTRFAHRLSVRRTVTVFSFHIVGKITVVPLFSLGDWVAYCGTSGTTIVLLKIGSSSLSNCISAHQLQTMIYTYSELDGTHTPSNTRMHSARREQGGLQQRQAYLCYFLVGIYLTRGR